MVLPVGMNKGLGLKAALERLAIGQEYVVGVGDAENDHSLLAGVGVGVAVSNALPSLCDEADFVLDKPASAGVERLVYMMLEGDPALTTRVPTVGEPVAEPAAAVEERVPESR
jgi:hydroxymethylpyrimidine pyrophosphatase-like HAD family hydrolase